MEPALPDLFMSHEIYEDKELRTLFRPHLREISKRLYGCMYENMGVL